MTSWALNFETSLLCDKWVIRKRKNTSGFAFVLSTQLFKMRNFVPKCKN